MSIRLQIKAIKDVIKGKESRGEDASYERDLLKAWSKVKGWEAAGRALVSLEKSKPRHASKKVM